MEANRLEEAKKLSRRLVKKYNPHKIILFGSVGRGEGGEDSDIDLLVIKESSLKRPFRAKKVFEILRGLNRKYALDVIVYTPQEVKDRLNKGDYFLKEVLNEGQVLYG